jgi:hypothetical protein
MEEYLIGFDGPDRAWVFCKTKDVFLSRVHKRFVGLFDCLGEDTDFGSIREAIQALKSIVPNLKRGKLDSKLFYSHRFVG